MAAKPKKKGQVGKTSVFITRTKALRKLQIGLKEFRTLCIYKGIYPRLPGTKAKYHRKDIAFLSHDPLLNYFRKSKVYRAKLKKLVHKQNKARIEVAKTTRPQIKLDHIIKERYPTFDHALADLDDALNMLFLFSRLPIIRQLRCDIVRKCRLRTAEFLHYVILSGSLKKTFISVKGIYYQAEIHSHRIIWVTPHPTLIEVPTDVDISVMINFAEIYLTLVEFINFKLYQELSVPYPPKLHFNETEELKKAGKMNQDDRYIEMISSLNVPIKTTESVVAVKKADDGISKEFASIFNKVKSEDDLKIFKNLKFFLSRELNKESLTFLIRSFGGQASSEDAYSIGIFKEDDKSINYQVVDRRSLSNHNLSRYYVQPQWVFDCVNHGKLLPIENYVPGAILPPHLSPFDETYAKVLKDMNEEEATTTVSSENIDEIETFVDESIDLKTIFVNKKPKSQSKELLTPAQRKLALMKLSKKKRRMFDIATSKSTRTKSKEDKIKKKRMLLKNYKDPVSIT